MRIALRALLWILATTVVAAAALALYLRSADLSVYEEPIEKFLSGKIGHQLDIDGLFELQVRNLTKLTAEQVTIQNTSWSSEPLLVDAGHISITIDIWSLVRGPLIVESLEIRDIVVYLERDAEGLANWDTGRPVSDEAGDFDTELIAFRDVNVENVKIAFVDPARRRPLDISIEQLIIRPDENDILDLDLRGVVNEIPLWADGKLGPWQNLLDGKDLTADLDVTLGQVRLSVAGSAVDLKELEGVEATIGLGGPSIDRVADRLGLPPFAEGPFRIDGRLRRLESGNHVRFEGNLGAIDIFASGSVDRLLRPKSTQLDFSVSGPDTKYVAELLGVEGAPAVPFRIAGDVNQKGSRLAFSRTRAELGANVVAIEGWAETEGALPDIDLTINASGPNFSVFAPFVGVDGVPAEPFNIAGRIEKSDANWRFSDVVALVGENRIAAHGSIGDGDDTEIEFSATGPDISFLQPMTGLQGLPAKSFDVSARIKPARDGIRVENASGLFGDHRIELDGIVKTNAGLTGTRLDFHASGPELKNVALLTGVPYLPAGPFDFAGEVTFERDRLVINDGLATVGELQATASGTFGLDDKAGEFDIVASANGPDVASLVEFEPVQRLANQAFSLNARVKRARDGDELEFIDSKFKVGEIVLSADGALNMDPMSNDSDLRFSLSGPDISQLGRAAGIGIEFDKAFTFSGQFTGTPIGFAMRDFSASIGNSAIEGAFEVDLREKPRLAGSLSSTLIDLTERRPTDGDEQEQTAAAGKDELLLSAEPIDFGVLQAADIDLAVRIDQLRTNTVDVLDFNAGIHVANGELVIDPISFVESDGSMIGQVRLSPSDGRHRLSVSFTAENLNVGLTDSQDRSALPPLSGTWKLEGAGNSLHELMATSNGTLVIRQDSGHVKEMGGRKLFGDLLLRIIRALNPRHEEKVYRVVDCGRYDVRITDGVAVIENFAIQTDTMTVIVLGNLDFNTEKLNLTVRAKPREGIGVSVGGTVNSFLKVGGTLRNPKLQIDPKGTLVSGGAAVATGGLSILAKGLYDRLSANKDICATEADGKSP